MCIVRYRHWRKINNKNGTDDDDDDDDVNYFDNDKGLGAEFLFLLFLCLFSPVRCEVKCIFAPVFNYEDPWDSDWNLHPFLTRY